MDKDYKKQEKRIKAVFAAHDDISRGTVEIYKNYLEKNLNFPIELTGIEDFNWEEFYVFGPGDQDEYEELKKTKTFIY